MQVLNVHQREIPVPAAVVAALLNSLASGTDALWPKTMWPAMHLDRALGIGACGGHGPIRYCVEAFIPGTMVSFHFTGPDGFDGYHGFEILQARADCTVLRHTVEMEARGVACLSWPLVFRPLHEALLEDALALAEANAGVVPHVRPWSLWVKALRWVLSAGKARRQQTPGPASGG